MLIRFPEGSDLRQRLEERANANRRTLTAEVLDLLEFVLDPRTVQIHEDNLATHTKLLGEHEKALSDLAEQVDIILRHLGLDEPAKPKRKKG